MKKLFLFAFVLVLLSFSRQAASKHTPVSVPAFFADGKKINVYTTADSTNLRLSLTDSSLQWEDFGQPKETQPCVFVDPSKTFQTMVGIGGALTDATAETFAKLPAARQQELLEAFYSPRKGIGYTLARTNINSCDFSSDNYTYVADGDKTLKTFNVEHDRKFKIPLIKKAIAAAGGKLSLFVSPWSPPAWMKDNNDMLHGGKLKAEYADAWANYYVKFIQAYEKENIPVWGLTVQNEPMATQRWESCIYTGDDERDFIKNHLGPVLYKNNMAAKKLIAWDHNRDLVYQRAAAVLNDKDAAKYVWGIGFHWYEPWTGGTMQFENLKRVTESFPDKHLIFTEGCVEAFSLARVHEWSIGERYGRSMINDFNAGTTGWTDWNVFLDETGGPNHANNFCFAPVHANTTTGEIIYTNAYYYIGQFSKFIRPGAKRIVSAASRSELLTTAFMNTDGKIAVVVMNDSNKKIPYHIWIAGKAAAVTSLPHSIATLVF
jgi:glucosylceramidase